MKEIRIFLGIVLCILAIIGIISELDLLINGYVGGESSITFIDFFLLIILISFPIFMGIVFVVGIFEIKEVIILNKKSKQ